MIVGLYQYLNLGLDDQSKIQWHQEEIKNHINILPQNNLFQNSFKRPLEQIYQDQSFMNRSFVQYFETGTNKNLLAGKYSVGKLYK